MRKKYFYHVFALFSLLIFFFNIPVLAVDTPTPGWRGAIGTIDPGPMGDLTFGKIIAWMFAIFFVGIAMFALYELFMGAFNWVASAGDEKKLATARQTIMNAVIGLILSVVLITGWYVLTGSILKIFSPSGGVTLPQINP